MTTKLEQAEAIITKVEQMRSWQKEFLAKRDALALRKAKDLEKEIDTMIIRYRAGISTVDVLGGKSRQTTLEL